MSTNRAAWIDAPGSPLAIRPTPSPDPSTLSPNHLLIRVSAWGINPADLFVASTSLPFITYPVILGEDISGTVLATGTSASSRFKPGDRVLAGASGSALSKNEMGGFQEVVVVDAGLASGIPDTMGWAEGAVFPLTLATAACGLFERDFLGLPVPQVEGVDNAGKTVVVWGASSGVGCHAVQLAKAAGFDVVATASPRNFEYVEGLGARKVFDYASEGVVGDVVAEIDGGECVGILLAQGSLEACVEVAERSEQDLFVASAVAVPEDKVPEGVRARFIYGITRADAEICPAVFERFLPEALAQRKYQVAPKPLVVSTKGLEGIEEGFERLRAGVSAAKAVVVAE